MRVTARATVVNVPFDRAAGRRGGLAYRVLDGPHRGARFYASDTPCEGTTVTVAFVPDDQFATTHGDPPPFADPRDDPAPGDGVGEWFPFES